jgi:hypothetical protein
MLTIDTATAADGLDLAERITPADAAELSAAGLTVAECVDGTPAQALRWHGRLVCLFGVVDHPRTERGGVPWMLCTRTLDEVPRRAMVGISAQVVSGWLQQFDTLCNFIHRHNTGAIRFVEWLGFRVVREPCGPGNQFFVMEWKRHV